MYNLNSLLSCNLAYPHILGIDMNIFWKGQYSAYHNMFSLSQLLSFCPRLSSLPHFRVFCLLFFRFWKLIYIFSNFISYSTSYPDSTHWDKMHHFLLFCYFLKTSHATFRILAFRNLSTFELSLWVDCSLLGGKALCFVHFFITFVELKKNFFP